MNKRGGNIIEDELEYRNREELKGLGTVINDISMISDNIRNQLKTEKGLYNEVDAAFDKNQTLLGKHNFS